MADWVTLPRDEAIRAWRGKHRRLVVGLWIIVALPLVGIVAAKGNLDREDREVHATAQVTELLGGDTVALTWHAGERVQEAVYTDQDVAHDLGDEIDIAYPDGHPEDVHGLQGAAILVASLSVELVVAGNALALFFLRVRPLGRQVVLASEAGGTPAIVRFDETAGRRAFLWIGAPSEGDTGDVPRDVLPDPSAEPTGAVRVGGAPRSLPEGDLDAVVRGEVRPRGVVVVQLGEDLVNTTGLVHRRSTDD